MSDECCGGGGEGAPPETGDAVGFYTLAEEGGAAGALDLEGGF